MTARTTEDATGLVAAIGALTAATQDCLAAVTSGSALDVVPDDALLELLRQTERLRNQLSVVESALVRSATGRDLPQRHGHRRTAPWLAQLLRLAPAEAGRRVRASEALSPRSNMTGTPLPAERPALAAARTSGEVSPEHTSIVLSTLETLERRLGDSEPVSRAEADLTRYAMTFDPPGLRRIADHLLEVYDPDGAEPDDEAAQRQRFFRMRQRTDCTWTGEFHLTSEVGAQLRTVLCGLSTDRSSTLSDDVGSDGLSTTSASTGHVAERLGGCSDWLGELRRGDHQAPQQSSAVPGAGASGDDPGARRAALLDSRSHGQRTHDALADVCSLLLRSGELPAAGGIPATVIVTVREDQLGRGTGLARLAGGGTVPVSTLSRFAGQSDVWTVLTSRTGAPLQLGRTRRLASPAQTVALIARDGGCSFPGCHQPPQWCERHHVVEWASGGPTDLSNLTLLCRYHHRHHLDNGWRVSINGDGLPEWVPPVWVDPRQRPRVNDRIVLDHGSGVMARLPGAADGPGPGPHRPLTSGAPVDRGAAGPGDAAPSRRRVVSLTAGAPPTPTGDGSSATSSSGSPADQQHLAPEVPWLAPVPAESACAPSVSGSPAGSGPGTGASLDEGLSSGAADHRTDDWLSWVDHLAQENIGEDHDPDDDEPDDLLADEEVRAFIASSV